MSTITAIRTTTTGTSTGTTTGASRAKRTAGEKTGVILTTLVTLFLTMDFTVHLLGIDAVKEANGELGAPSWLPVVCGVVLATCVATYLVPRTAVLGAVLLTGYLGGATAVNLSHDMPLFNAFFAVATGVVVWAGLWFRDDRVKVLYTR